MFSLLKPGVVMNYKLTWASAGGGQNGHLPHLEFGTKNKKFMKKLMSAS